MKSLIARFEKAHPNIQVKVVGNMTDDKINQALRAGGDKAPDVVSSFTTNNVGKFCSSGAFVDLNPFFEKAGIDPEKIFPKAMNEYTQFEGNRCTVPLLGDAYGLYYNKTAFEKAGITSPPKTWSEFEADAKKLTISKGDSYSQLGFMPNYHGWESTTEHYFGQFSPTYFDSAGKSNIAKDPAFEAGFTLQKKLVDELGGYQKLEKYRSKLGDEWGPKHPFHTGQVAMQLDGEWRLGMAEEAKPGFEIGVAPLPVPDDQADQYGKGYITGTIAGIAATQQEAERGLGAGEVHDHGHRRGRRLRQRHPQRAVHARRPQVARAEVRPAFQDLPGHRVEPELDDNSRVHQRRYVPRDAPAVRIRLRERQGNGSEGGPEEDRRADRHGHRAGEVAAS